MKSLPTLLSTVQLDSLIATLAALPSAIVTRHPDTVVVTATRKATGETVKVLSATTNGRSQWHVMAVPGLVSVNVTA